MEERDQGVVERGGRDWGEATGAGQLTRRRTGQEQKRFRIPRGADQRPSNTSVRGLLADRLIEAVLRFPATTKVGQ